MTSSAMELTHVSLPIRQDFLDARRLRRFLDRYPILPGPQIIDFQPWTGHAGSLMVVVGRGFSTTLQDNLVLVGDIPCTVISAEENRLVVITSRDTLSGYVYVILRNAPDCKLRGPRPFYALDTPAGNLGSDGPPVFKQGLTKGWLSYSQTGALYMKKPNDQLPDDGPTYPVPTQEQMEGSNGQPFRANVLVLPVYPNDLPIPTLADHQAVVKAWEEAASFYTQATYGVWSFIPKVLDWAALEKDDSYYHDASPNKGKIRDSVAYELICEALSANHDTLSSPGMKLITVHMVGLVYFANGAFLSGANYGPMGDFTVVRDRAPTTWDFSNIPGMMHVGETAHWTRVVHVIGHTMMRTETKILVHAEDMRCSDLSEPNEATAERYEMMGAADEGPLFSSYFMLQRGWYSAWHKVTPGGSTELLRTNAHTEMWKAEPISAPFRKEFDIVAHGEAANTMPNMWHVLRIRIAEGLDYCVEVRERPPAGSSLVFDTNIPVRSGFTGGVVVTRVLYGQELLNRNQPTRTIALLHGRDRVRALTDGEEVNDPMRGIKITVVKTSVSSNPMVCRVRLEWNQAPPGVNTAVNTDLFIKPWDDDFKSQDVWVNRWLNNGQTEPNPGWPPTAPVNKGETPLVPSAGEPERHDFVARVRNVGTADARNVQVVHYVNSPPGVGDNSTREVVHAARDSHDIGTVPAGGESYSVVTWKPAVARHSCLQVRVMSQADERPLSNNFAQHNLFKFDSEAVSRGQPVEMVVAVRNPQDHRTLVRIEIDGVREGFAVYFPHRWVWLEAKAEKQFTLLVFPTKDIEDMNKLEMRRTKVRVMGFISREYKDKRMPSWWSSIGGITMEVTCKRTAKLVLEDRPYMDVRGILTVRGHMNPGRDREHILVTVEKALGEVISEHTTTDEEGRFSVEFWYERLKDRQGMVVAIQAAIVDSKEFVGAESNIVHWHNF